MENEKAPERKPRTPREMSDSEAEIHAEARRRFGKIMDKELYEREENREDRRFYSVKGAMWEGALGEQFENKPRLEVNKTSLSVMKLHSSFRKNPIAAKFISQDGTDTDELAEICAGLFRSDEQDSSAQEAYDNAFEEASAGGRGAWRLVTRYEDEEDEEDDKQRIGMEAIYDADQHVFFDANAKRYDKSDATHAFVLTPWTRDSYREEYSEDPANWPMETLSMDNFDWATDDSVWIAEYFRVESEKTNRVFFQDALGEKTSYLEEDLTEEKMAQLAALGAREIRSKTITKRTVMKYTMSGSRIIERPQRIAGTEIPVIPVYGKRNIVDNIERASGIVRLAKDIQRLKNMQMSRLAEIASKSTIEKPILFQEQVEGFEQEWANDAVEDYAYLRINMITDQNGAPVAAGAAGYTKSPSIPPALAALYAMVEEDIKEILGNQGGEEIVSNIAKDTVEQIHARLDMHTFIYMSNMAKSVQRAAEVWLSMAKELYPDQGRRMKVLNTEGGTSSVEMTEGENDLSTAKYNVTTSVAPASASRKTAIVRNMMNMARATTDPELQLVTSLTAAMNSEGEGTDGLRKFARKKLVGMGVEEPTDEEAEEMRAQAESQAEQKDPATIIAEAELMKAKADVEEARIRRMTAEADKAKKMAETAAILAKMEREDRGQFMESLDLLMNRMDAEAQMEAQALQPPVPAIQDEGAG